MADVRAEPVFLQDVVPAWPWFDWIHSGFHLRFRQLAESVRVWLSSSLLSLLARARTTYRVP